MDTSAITDDIMKAECTHCGFDFSEPAPILTIREPVSDTHYIPHDLCPKCLYIDTIVSEYIKRDVPLVWEDFMKSAEEHSKAEFEAYYRMFAENAIAVKPNKKKKTITYTFIDERYGKNTVDMVVQNILVYLEHREMQRRFANLKGREALIEKYEKLLLDIKEARVYAHSKIYSGNELLDNTQERFEEFIVELKKLM